MKFCNNVEVNMAIYSTVYSHLGHKPTQPCSKLPIFCIICTPM